MKRKINTNLRLAKSAVEGLENPILPEEELPIELAEYLKELRENPSLSDTDFENDLREIASANDPVRQRELINKLMTNL